MKKISPFIVVTLLAFFTTLAAAQEQKINLKLTRDFGYGGGKQIQGTFSLRASGSEDLVQVDFIIDGEVVNVDTEAPFRYQFNTSMYSPGVHSLTAIGTLSDGTRITAREYQREFITGEEANAILKKIVMPFLIILGAIILAVSVGPLLLGRKREYKPGVYGPAGGAICPRCTFPYSRSLFSPNLITGKLERCPHCGKWAIVSRATPGTLQEAEARLNLSDTPDHFQGQSEEERLRKLIDESRFDN